MKNKNNCRGSLTIEASLALSFFILGFMTILSLAGLIKAERSVQYGINQTAREISEYCYTADKAGLTSALSASSMSVGDAVEQISGLSGDSSNVSSGTSDIISEMVDIMLGDRSDESLNGIAAEGICRLLLPKYISGDRNKTDQYLDNLCGITLNDINFRHSSFLRDGKTIRIVAIYRVNIDPLGIIPGNGFELDLKNSASTRAWIPETLDSAEEESEEENISSRWLIPGNQPRGQSWKKLILSENSGCAVLPGKGIDIYDESGGIMKEVYSLNIFTSTYTTSSDNDSTDPDDYSLKGKAAANKIVSYAKHVCQSYTKLKDNLKMEDGSEKPLPSSDPELGIIIVLPEEAEKNSGIMQMLSDVSDKIKNDHNVTAEFQFRERALFTAEERQRGEEQLCGSSQQQ